MPNWFALKNLFGLNISMAQGVEIHYPIRLDLVKLNLVNILHVSGLMIPGALLLTWSKFNPSIDK